MQMQVVNYKPINKGTLQGFIDIFIPSLNWTITGCGLFMKENRKWVNMPSRSKKDPDTGVITYSDVISMSKEDKSRFSNDAIQAYKEYNPEPSREQEVIDF
jgi:hypothetical protein